MTRVKTWSDIKSVLDTEGITSHWLEEKHKYTIITMCDGMSLIYYMAKHHVKGADQIDFEDNYKG